MPDIGGGDPVLGNRMSELVMGVDSNLGVFNGAMNCTALPESSLKGNVSELTGLFCSIVAPVEISNHGGLEGIQPHTTPVNTLPVDQKGIM